MTIVFFFFSNLEVIKILKLHNLMTLIKIYLFKVRTPLVLPSVLAPSPSPQPFVICARASAGFDDFTLLLQLSNEAFKRYSGNFG